MSGHALLSASSAHRWMNCPPSALKESQFSETTVSPYALEGTRAHAAAEWKLTTWLKTGQTPDSPDVDDEEMQDCTSEYRDYVIRQFEAARTRTPDAQLIVEQRLDYSRWVPGGFGTGDAVIIADGELDIIDLKYGKGVAVSAEGNPQLMLYAAGAVAAYEMLYDIHTVRTHIFQPRLHSISVAEFDIQQLTEWLENDVKPVALLASKGQGEYKAGSWCQFCHIKAQCRARARQMTDVLEARQDPALLTAEEIAELLPRLELAGKWVDDVKSFALEKALVGQKFPGYKLVEVPGRRRITDQDALAKALTEADYKPEDYMKAPEMKTITALERLVGKKRFAALAEGCLGRGRPNPALVPDTDKRKEWQSGENDFAEELNNGN